MISLNEGHTQLQQQQQHEEEEEEENEWKSMLSTPTKTKFQKNVYI